MEHFNSFLDHHPDTVRVRIERARGSVPRGAGTEMLVATDALHGTIGGGQLEYMAIDTARAMLRSGRTMDRMDQTARPGDSPVCATSS